MPQHGEIRRGASESVQWNGSRWIPVTDALATVDKPASFGPLDLVPGLRDVLNLPLNAVKGASALPDVVRGLVHDPGATLKGFAQGSSEASTPGRVGLLALLTGGATLPAAIGAAGGEAVAQGTRLATDAPNAPQSFPEAALNTAEAASVPAIGAGLKAIPAGVEKLGGSGNLARRLIGAGVGGYAGYKADGIPGALAGAVTGGLGLKGLRSVMGLGAPEAVASEAPAALESAIESKPMTKGDWLSARDERFPFQKEEVPYRMEGAPDQNPAELFQYQKDALAKPDLSSESEAPVSATMRGLYDGIAPQSDEVTRAGRDAMVGRYLNAPDSVFSRLRTGTR